MRLKTSQEWYDLVPESYKLVIMDPDGWDRTNYQYSFHEEKITKREFMNRVFMSTCSSKNGLALEKWFSLPEEDGWYWIALDDEAIIPCWFMSEIECFLPAGLGDSSSSGLYLDSIEKVGPKIEAPIF